MFERQELIDELMLRECIRKVIRIVQDKREAEHLNHINEEAELRAIIRKLILIEADDLKINIEDEPEEVGFIEPKEEEEEEFELDSRQSNEYRLGQLESEEVFDLLVAKITQPYETFLKAGDFTRARVTRDWTILNFALHMIQQEQLSHSQSGRDMPMLPSGFRERSLGDNLTFGDEIDKFLQDQTPSSIDSAEVEDEEDASDKTVRKKLEKVLNNNLEQFQNAFNENELPGERDGFFAGFVARLDAAYDNIESLYSTGEDEEEIELPEPEEDIELEPEE